MLRDNCGSNEEFEGADQGKAWLQEAIVQYVVEGLSLDATIVAIV